MPGDGWLFLGAAEALAVRDAPFEPQRVDGTYAYGGRGARRRRPARGARPGRPWRRAEHPPRRRAA